jgi:hypothetical protein
MATNPFIAKTYVDTSREQKSSNSQMSTKDNVTESAKSQPNIVIKDNEFTRKSRGFSKENSTFDRERVGTETKEGIYTELSPEGKLETSKGVVSSRKTPDFTGIDTQRNKDVSLVEGDVPSGIIKNVERGEPNPVRTFNTGRSEIGVAQKPNRPDDIPIPQGFREVVRKAQSDEARITLESRRKAQIEEYKRQNKGLENSYQYQYDIQNLQDRPIENFANYGGIFAFSNLGKRNREILKDNPQIFLSMENNKERDIAQRSSQMKSDLIKKEIGGGMVTDLIYGNVAPVRLVGEGVSGVRGSKSRFSFSQDIYQQEFEKQGLSGSDARTLSRSTSRGSVFGADIIESSALIVGPELISERLAGKTISDSLAKLGSIEASSSFKPILKSTIIPSMKLGAREGAESVAFQNIASGQDINPLEVGIGAGFGATSTPIFLSLPLALRPTKPRTSKVIMGVGEALEFGQETGGDILASKTKIFSDLEDVRLVERIDTSSGKRMVSFSGERVGRGSVVAPTFTNILNPSQSSASSSNTVGASTSVIQNAFGVSDKSLTSNFLFSNDITPVDIGRSNTGVPVPPETNVPVDVTTGVPVFSSTVVPNVVMANGLPFMPPIMDFGGSSKGRSQRQGKKYYNELALGLSLLGSRPNKNVKKSKKMKKDRGNKNRRVDLGFGALGSINLGRI